MRVLVPLLSAVIILTFVAARSTSNAAPDVEQGMVSIMDAANRNDAAELHRLVGNGSNVDAQDATGMTALMIAAAAPAGGGNTTRALLQLGARPERANGRGFTPLHWAALSGDVSTLRLLLDVGGDPDAANVQGATPLMLAAIGGRVEHVLVLLEGGANPAAGASQGRTAADVARMMDRHEVADLIERWPGENEQANGALRLQNCALRDDDGADAQPQKGACGRAGGRRFRAYNASDAESNGRRL